MSMDLGISQLKAMFSNTQEAVKLFYRIFSGGRNRQIISQISSSVYELYNSVMFDDQNYRNELAKLHDWIKDSNNEDLVLVTFFSTLKSFFSSKDEDKQTLTMLFTLKNGPNWKNPFDKDEFRRDSKKFYTSISMKLNELFIQEQWQLLFIDLIKYQTEFLTENFISTLNQLINDNNKHKLDEFFNIYFNSFRKNEINSININLGIIFKNVDKVRISDIWTELRFYDSTRRFKDMNIAFLYGENIKEKDIDFDFFTKFIPFISDDRKVGIINENKYLLSTLSFSPLSKADIKTDFLPFHSNFFDFSSISGIEKEINLEDLRDYFKFYNFINNEALEDSQNIFNLKDINQILILGKGGTGKSTFLKKIKFDLLQLDQKERILPILIELYEFSNKLKSDTSLSVEKYILDVIKGSTGDKIPNNITLDEITACFNLWVLIDAIDEIQYSVKENVIKKLNLFFELNPNISLIITSRPEAPNLQDIIFPSHMRRLIVQKLTREQLMKYLKKYHYIVFKESKKSVEANVKQFIDKLEKTGIISIIDSFLFATLVTLAYRLPQPLQDPDERLTKYDILFKMSDYLINKWDKERKKEDLLNFNLEKEFISQVLFNMANVTFINSSAKALEFHQNELIAYLKKIKKGLEKVCYFELAHQINTFLVNRGGFNQNSPISIAFPHRMLRDIFLIEYFKIKGITLNKIELENLDDHILSVLALYFINIFQANYISEIVLFFERLVNLEDVPLINKFFSYIYDFEPKSILKLPIKLYFDILLLNVRKRLDFTDTNESKPSVFFFYYELTNKMLLDKEYLVLSKDDLEKFLLIVCHFQLVNMSNNSLYKDLNINLEYRRYPFSLLIKHFGIEFIYDLSFDEQISFENESELKIFLEMHNRNIISNTLIFPGDSKELINLISKNKFTLKAIISTIYCINSKISQFMLLDRVLDSSIEILKETYPYRHKKDKTSFKNHAKKELEFYTKDIISEYLKSRKIKKTDFYEKLLSISLRLVNPDNVNGLN